MIPVLTTTSNITTNNSEIKRVRVCEETRVRCLGAAVCSVLTGSVSVEEAVAVVGCSCVPRVCDPKGVQCSRPSRLNM